MGEPVPPLAPEQVSGQLADQWLGLVLVEAGLLTTAQTAELTSGEPVWEGVVTRGWSTDEAILAALEDRFHTPRADFRSLDPRAAAFVPESLARRHLILPLTADDKKIRIATTDPRDLDLEQTLGFVTGRMVDLALATPAELRERIDDVYRPEKSVNRLLKGLAPATVEQVDDAPITLPEAGLEAPMTRLVDAMIADAVREGASDIHGEPVEGLLSVRYRIDGVLREVMRLPGTTGPAMVRRVKILAKLDVTDPLRPHDGRAAVRVEGRNVDLRISTVPIARRGEKVVIRILNRANLRQRVADLELPPEEESVFQRILMHRDGMVLVTGPTGSGKTTTLYAVLNQLKTGEVNIVTIEDPVEYDIAGISQLQVNEAQGFTFATALRSVLRQDPDIVLVGEIRDAETAGIAVQAGQTGHLVLSTLHTNDAASSVPRLRDLGMDGFNIASVLRGIVAQRLVRTLCRDCSEPVPVASLPPGAQPAPEHPATPRKAVGCRACGGTGYRGRTAILEILRVEERVAHLIEGGALPDVLVEAARPLGMRSLWESGLDRVWRGLTTVEEVERVLGERAHESPQAPLAVPSAPTVEKPAETDLAASRAVPHVLVADDDRQMRGLVKRILLREGFTVEEAADGLDALDAIDARPPDLMILDMDMPRLDGLGVLEELQARVMTASLPIIVLTARDDETEIKALDLGAHDYLTKPVQPASLAARVKAVLRRARMA